jgi:hypothetical protein
MSLTEMLPAIRELPTQDKIRLIRILAQELDTEQDAFPLDPCRIHYLLTPYHAFGAGSALMDAMKKAEAGES